MGPSQFPAGRQHRGCTEVLEIHVSLGIITSVTIQHTVAARVAIVQGSVGRAGVLVNGQILPLGNVLLGNARIIGCVGCVARLVSNDSHSLNTNHALQCQVGLVANGTGQ